MAFCPHCGKPTEPGTSFCTACGRALPPAAPAPSPAMPQPRPLDAPMAPPTPATPVRPVGVTIIGAVSIVMGAGAAMFALMMLVMAMVGSAWVDSFGRGYWWMEVPAAFVAVMAVFAAIAAGTFAAIAIAAGVGSLQGKAWAWVLTIIVMGLNGLRAIGDLRVQNLVGAMFTLLISVGVIVYYFQPDVKRWFGRPA